MSKLTLLEMDQVDSLDIFEKYGTRAAISDFAICLGGYVSDNYTNEGNHLKNRTGWYWTKTDDGSNDVRVVASNGDRHWNHVYERYVGCRPALPFSEISRISSNRVRGINDEIEYGEYPQSVAKNQKELERLFKKGKLSISTLPGPTIDTQKYNAYNKDFKPEQLIRYEYNRESFVRVKVNSSFDGDYFKLSDGNSYKDGDYVWIKYEPVKWLSSKKDNIAVCKNIICAGVQFNQVSNYTGNFSLTNMYNYIDIYLTKDLNLNNTYKKTNLENKENYKIPNPYNFTFDMVSEEDIIKGSVESGVAVFIHGKSGDGKSARVRQIDPDCEIVSIGTLSPELLIGMALKNNDEKKVEYIAPPWYQRLVDKCEKEPNKIHILFLDELTNASLNMQKYGYSIALDRKVNDFFELPKNCRVVAAGNEINDSKAASEIAEPLFNRFAHVYIDTTVESWLNWAVTPAKDYKSLTYKEDENLPKIHPSILAFISYKREKALRSEYNGETPNADPRKWEMASKILYKTKNPEMLRSLVGNALTSDFVEFCSKKIITIEDVINNNYNESNLEMDISEKHATVVGLSFVDEKNVKIIRNFVANLDPEFLALFDTLWCRDDEKRLEKIAELRMSESKKGARI